MTIRNAIPILWKYLLVVATSCLLAFVISQEGRAAAAPEVMSPPKVPPVAEVSSVYSTPGRYEVLSADETWTDSARKRTLPVRVLFPKAPADDPAMKFPVIVFSHGLGGSKIAGKLWSEHWVSHGYVVVSLQHPGSDESIWKDKAAGQVEASLKGAMTMTNLGLRVGDVHFAIDEIIRRANSTDSTFSAVDVNRIGMSGHSFGAQTTLSVSGQQNPSIAGQSGFDKRIKAAIAFSPNARSKKNLDKQFGDIRLPFFSVTGTKDGEVLGDGTTVEHRTLPFKNMPAGDKYLMVLEGGDHMIFGGQRFARQKSMSGREEEIRRDVRAATLAFWNSYLKDDKPAKVWLTGGGTQNSALASLATNDRFEFK